MILYPVISLRAFPVAWCSTIKVTKSCLRILSHLPQVTLSWRVMVRKFKRTEADLPSSQCTLSTWVQSPAVFCLSSSSAPSRSSFLAPAHLTDPRGRLGPLLGNVVSSHLNTMTPLFLSSLTSDPSAGPTDSSFQTSIYSQNVATSPTSTATTLVQANNSHWFCNNPLTGLPASDLPLYDLLFCLHNNKNILK